MAITPLVHNKGIDLMGGTDIGSLLF